MPITEDLKEYAERATGLRRPGKRNVQHRSVSRTTASYPIIQNGRCLSDDGDFLVVGAYPPAGTYDECSSIEDRPRALKTIPKVARPQKDPVYGTAGPLSKLWKKAK